MRLTTTILLLLISFAGCACAQTSGGFQVIDIFVNSGDELLAAYQVHVKAGAGVSIVGIEGGEHDAFRKPPYYDPKAMQRNEVKLAAFSTLKRSKLPRGRTRVATLHVISNQGTPEFSILSRSIGNESGERLAPPITFELREKKE